MKNTLKFTFLLLLVTCIGIQCQKQQDFDKSAMLENIVTAYVLPTLADLDLEVKELEESTLNFVQTPNISTLTAAQQNWKETMAIWSRIEMLDFGPANDAFIYLELDNTPINVSSIEQLIGDTIIIDSLTILNRSSYTKGLATIEYLLFSTANTSLVSLYDTDIKAASRAAYLVNSIKNAKGLIEKLNFQWKENGEAYGNTLINDTGNKTSGGIGRFSNAITHIAQTMSRKKVGKPLGKEAFGGVSNMNLVESKYADFSWEIIQNNLRGVEEIFGTSDDLRLGSYLTTVLGTNTLTEDIEKKIQLIETAIAARQQSLKIDIQQDKAAVEAIYTDLKELYELLGRDMAIGLSITILPNPDDGD